MCRWLIAPVILNPSKIFCSRIEPPRLRRRINLIRGDRRRIPAAGRMSTGVSLFHSSSVALVSSVSCSTLGRCASQKVRQSSACVGAKCGKSRAFKERRGPLTKGRREIQETHGYFLPYKRCPCVHLVGLCVDRRSRSAMS